MRLKSFPSLAQEPSSILRSTLPSSCNSPVGWCGSKPSSPRGAGWGVDHGQRVGLPK